MIWMTARSKLSSTGSPPPGQTKSERGGKIARNDYPRGRDLSLCLPYPYPTDDPALLDAGRMGRRQRRLRCHFENLAPSGEPLRRAIRYIPGVQAVFCALIVLAFAMAPAVGMAGSATPMGSAVHSGCDQYHSSQNEAGLRLCSMSVCHPGVAAIPVSMSRSKPRYVHDFGLLREGTGILPELELPPPRSAI